MRVNSNVYLRNILNYSLDGRVYGIAAQTTAPAMHGPIVPETGRRGLAIDQLLSNAKPSALSWRTIDSRDIRISYHRPGRLLEPGKMKSRMA